MISGCLKVIWNGDVFYWKIKDDKVGGMIAERTTRLRGWFWRRKMRAGGRKERISAR
jgi:hypothetical protein